MRQTRMDIASQSIYLMFNYVVIEFKLDLKRHHFKFCFASYALQSQQNVVM